MLRQPNVHKALLGLLLGLLITSPYSLASNQISDQSVFEYINQSKGSQIKDLTRIDFSDEQPNPYLSISKFYLKDAPNLVFEALSNEFVVAQDTIRDVVIRNKRPDKLNVTNVINRFKQASNDVRSIQNQKITTFAREVFMNNELDDSPFDLIADLSKLENILFKTQSEVLLDGMYDSSALTGLPMGFSNVSNQASPIDPETDTEQSQNNEDQSSEPQDNQDPSQIDQNDTQVEVIQQPESNECEIDPELSNQLDQAASQASLESEPSPTNTEQAGGSNNLTPPIPTENPNSENPQAQDPQEQVSSRNSDTSPLPFSDYPTLNNECPADQVFCLKKEEIPGRWGLVIPADRDCVACKIEQIKAGMNQVLAVNLVPKKVTGNFGEFPYCKEELKKSLIVFDFKVLSRPMRAEDPTREIREADISDVLPTSSPQETTTLATDSIIDRDVEAIAVEEALQEANRELDIFTDQINDLKRGYTDILSRLDLFNRHINTISTALRSLRTNALELTKKSKCE